jgi:hypothetical protein
MRIQCGSGSGSKIEVKSWIRIRIETNPIRITQDGRNVECTSCKSQIEFYKTVSFLCTVGWGWGGWGEEGGCNRKRTCDHHLQQYSVLAELVIALLTILHIHVCMYEANNAFPPSYCIVYGTVPCTVLCLLQCVRQGCWYNLPPPPSLAPGNSPGFPGLPH